MSPSLRAVRGSAYRSGERVRELLLEAAGEVFAEKGYDRATSREICDIAGVNTAAVNYRFGGIDALYVETLRRAHQGIVTVEEVRRIAESDLSPRDKLIAYLGPVVRRIADPAKRPWHMRLVCREMLSPSGLRDQIVGTEVQPKTDDLHVMLAEMIGAGQDEPVVGEAALMVIAPILIMATATVPILETLAPSTEEAAAKAEALSAHYERFILGGLDAVAKAYRAERGKAPKRPPAVLRSLPAADPDAPKRKTRASSRRATKPEGMTGV